MQNILLHALGVQEHIDLNEAEWTLADGDRVLLCTDGLTHMASDAGIAETLAGNSDPQACADRLVALANTHGRQHRRHCHPCIGHFLMPEVVVYHVNLDRQICCLPEAE